MRKQLFLDIQDILKSIKDDNDQQVIKHFDLWNQNVEFIEQDTPFEFPAVFIEFPPIPWQPLGQRTSQAEMIFRLHIVTQWLRVTAEYSPEQTEALEYLDLPEKIYNAIQCSAASESNGFMCINTITNHNHETILDTIEEYKMLVRRIPVLNQISIENIEPVISQNNQQ
jgi:hypothetical protein